MLPIAGVTYVDYEGRQLLAIVALNTRRDSDRPRGPLLDLIIWQGDRWIQIDGVPRQQTNEETECYFD